MYDDDLVRICRLVRISSVYELTEGFGNTGTIIGELLKPREACMNTQNYSYNPRIQTIHVLGKVYCQSYPSRQIKPYLCLTKSAGIAIVWVCSQVPQEYARFYF